jgi:hypothetical protein
LCVVCGVYHHKQHPIIIGPEMSEYRVQAWRAIAVTRQLG